MSSQDAQLAELEARAAHAEKRIADLEKFLNESKAPVQPGVQGTLAERREAEILKENEKLRYQIKHLKRALLAADLHRSVDPV